MTELNVREENQVENEAAGISDDKMRLKIVALDYVGLSLADPSYGDARRDELALAVLAACIGRAKRRKS